MINICTWTIYYPNWRCCDCHRYMHRSLIHLLYSLHIALPLAHRWLCDLARVLLLFLVCVSFSKIPFSHFHSHSKWLSSASFDTRWLSQRIQLSAKLHKILKSTAATFIEIMSCIRCHQQNDPVELQLDSLHNVMNDMKNESNAYAATHIQTHTNNSEKKNSNRTTLRWILLNWAEQSWAEPNQVKLS